jgi:hypothetical protein
MSWQISIPSLGFEFDKQFTLFFQSLKWRKQIGADEISKDYVIPEVIDKYYTGGLVGYDKEGSPLWIDPFGHIDLKGKGHRLS